MEYMQSVFSQYPYSTALSAFGAALVIPVFFKLNDFRHVIKFSFLSATLMAIAFVVRLIEISFSNLPFAFLVLVFAFSSGMSLVRLSSLSSKGKLKNDR